MAAADDLAVAEAAFVDEAQILQALVAQCSNGDPSAKVELAAELTNATQLKTIYTQEIPGVDTTVLDTAIAEANATLNGKPLAPVVINATAPAAPAAAASGAPSGLKLGAVVIPWSAVLATGAFVGLAWYLSSKKKR